MEEIYIEAEGWACFLAAMQYYSAIHIHRGQEPISYEEAGQIPDQEFLRAMVRMARVDGIAAPGWLHFVAGVLKRRYHGGPPGIVDRAIDKARSIIREAATE